MVLSKLLAGRAAQARAEDVTQNSSVLFLCFESQSQPRPLKLTATATPLAAARGFFKEAALPHFSLSRRGSGLGGGRGPGAGHALRLRGRGDRSIRPKFMRSLALRRIGNVRRLPAGRTSYGLHGPTHRKLLSLGFFRDERGYYIMPVL